MTLPRTPQEFTQFALEQGGHAKTFYMRTLERQTQYSKQQVREWIKQSAKSVPEAFDIEHVRIHSLQLTTVYIAGVPLLNMTGHRTLASTFETMADI